MTPLPVPGEITLRRLLEPFAKAMGQPDTREIVVTKPGSFGVEGDAGWAWYEDDRLNYPWLEALGRLAGRMTHQDLSSVAPTCSSRLPDSQRITVAMPPAMPEGVIQLTIRQRARSFDATLGLLDERRYFEATEGVVRGGGSFRPAEGWAAWLRCLVAERRANIVVTGEIGSSKTTLAEALIKEIPDWERVGTFESTPEWDLERRNLVPMRYAQEKKAGIGLRSAEEALEDGLRMRLDRVLFGELRNAEAWAWLRSLQAGLRGSVATCHGGTGLAGLFRALNLMIRQSPHSASVPETTLLDMVDQHIDVVIHCKRTPGDEVPDQAAHIEVRTE